MTTSFKQEQSFDSSSGSQCFDPLDSFINYDQAIVPTPSISPLSSRSKSISTPTTSSTLLSQQDALLSAQSSQQQTFAGPSHQYEQYRQQAGLPVGALANTFAVNQIDQFNLGRDQLSYGMNPPSDGYFGTNTPDDFLDFGLTPTQTSNGDMDLDFGSPTAMTPPNPDFINPAAISGKENPTRTQPTSNYPGRVYPGMHQQAALAKAQAEAARQQQQANTSQHQRATAPGHSRQSSRSATSSRPPTDPIVEESISRLLNQMRHSSVTSSNDDASTPHANGNSFQARARKDEEEMDEDERLLASEEGKKLSSKERRQLRNKVSARAFRSRRKEYIGQLEGEIATKQSEADELRRKNEELMSENTRLTDLTRMLLSSPAFSTFLNDLSGTGAPVSLPELSDAQNQTSTQRSHSAAPRKDVNPNQPTSHQTSGQQQNNMQIGLTMIPEESSLDYNAAGPLDTGFTGNVDFGGLYDAQVYAVTSVPQGPAVDSIDFAMLHGKSSNFVGPYPEADDSKVEPATIDRRPSDYGKIQMPEPLEIFSEEDDTDDSDPCFDLFRDQPSLTVSMSTSTTAPEDSIFGGIELEKVFGRIELTVPQSSDEDATLSATTIERFEQLCSRLEASSARITAATGRI